MSAIPKPQSGRERERRTTPLSGRSRKRAVSTGGRSDSRIAYNQPIFPLDSSLKSFSLGFNFNPPTPGTVSFTSTGTGKWWKTKFGLKKLVNSVRRKKKKMPNKSDFCTEALLEKSELELKKRRLDFEKEFRNKELQSASPTAFTKMDEMTSPVIPGEAGKEKPIPNEVGSGKAMTPEKMGPGGENLKQKDSSPSPNLDVDKDCSFGFRTPSQSKSELQAESDASFVMCESSEDLLSNVGKIKISEQSPYSTPLTATTGSGCSTDEANIIADTSMTSTENSGGDQEQLKSSASGGTPGVLNSPDNVKPSDGAETEPGAPKVEHHCPKCSCKCSGGPFLQEQSWGHCVILFIAMLVGVYFQYYYVFPLFKK